MAEYEVGHKKPPKSGQIKKGEVRNPKGAGAHTSRLNNTHLKQLTQKEVQELGSALLQGDLKALKHIIDNREEEGRSVIQVWIASIAYRAIVKGDCGPLEVLLNRFVGKVPDKMEVTNPDGSGIIGNKITIELIEPIKK